MSRKKDGGKDPAELFNPYFGKAKDDSHMAEKPFWTWLFIVPGAIVGGVVGFMAEKLVIGLLFGLVMGIAGGSMLDKFLEKRREKKKEE